MNYLRLMLYGVGVFLVTYAFAFLFVMLATMDTLIAKLAVPIAAGAIAYAAARALGLKSTSEALMCSLAWLAIAVLGDLALTVPFSGFEIFQQWNVWLGYIVIVLAPFLAWKQ